MWLGIMTPPMMRERSAGGDALVGVVDEGLAEEIKPGGGGGLILRAVAAARVEPLLERILVSTKRARQHYEQWREGARAKLTGRVARAGCTRASA